MNQGIYDAISFVEMDDKRYLTSYGRIIPTGLAEYMHDSPVLLNGVCITLDEVKEGFRHFCVLSPSPNGPECHQMDRSGSVNLLGSLSMACIPCRIS
jgi:hypothetical protein